jgi:hypothetical protein
MEVTLSLYRALQQQPDRVSTVFGDRLRTVADNTDYIRSVTPSSAMTPSPAIIAATIEAIE